MATNSEMYDVLSAAFNSELSFIHQRRLQAYRNYWLYYLGKHWSYARDEGEPQLTFNYCRRLVDMHTNFAFKKGFKNIVTDDPTTDDLDESVDRDFVRKLLEETWRKNKQILWCLNAGQMGGVTGDCFVRVSWDDTNPLEEPFARADVLPSHFCFPDFGGHSGWDMTKLKRMIIMIPVYTEIKVNRLANRGFQLANKTESTHRVSFLMEEWVAPIVSDDPAIAKPAMYRLYKGKEILKEAVNPIGVIPVVHISNYPLSGEYYGISDLSDITELNRELNEKATDVSDIINYHGSPITIIEGAKLKDLEKGVNRVWGIPENASVKNLMLEGDLEAANSYRKDLKTSILELSGTPPQALGTIQPLSNTTGVAMQLQYLPMIEKRDVKVEAYGEGIEAVNRLIIRTTEVADAEFGAEFSKLRGDKYRNTVVFPDPMPQDERRELEMSRERLDMGISNKKKELERQGHSQKEIEDILDGAAEDVRRESQLTLEYGNDTPFNTGPGRGEGQLTRGGPDETRGEKISETVAAE